MRLLHLADWHLGRRTSRESRAPDHDASIAEMVAIARDSRPDLVLHAGDLWDTGRPAHDDLLRGVEALRELASVAPVLVICGNHDSPALFRALGRLPGVADHVTFVASADDAPLAVPMAGGGRLLAGGVPYVHPNRATGAPDAYAAETRRLLGDAAARLRGAARRGDRVALGAHLHVGGAALSTGVAAPAELHAASPDALPALDYVALGHVHRPQPIGSSLARYAGSPIPLDFGEARDEKSLALVTAGAEGPPRAETIPLRAGRPLVAIECTLDELPSHAEAARGSICRVAVTVDEPIEGLADRVRAALPDATLVDVEARVGAGPGPGPDVGGDQTAHDSPIDELFGEYLAAAGVPGATADRLLARFADVMAAAEAEGRWTPPELARLEGQDPQRGPATPPERAPGREPVDAAP